MVSLTFTNSWRKQPYWLTPSETFSVLCSSAFLETVGRGYLYFHCFHWLISTITTVASRSHYFIPMCFRQTKERGLGWDYCYASYYFHCTFMNVSWCIYVCVTQTLANMSQWNWLHNFSTYICTLHSRLNMQTSKNLQDFFW